MTIRSSRYIRPEHPTPLALTSRDCAVLSSVFEHRYLSAEHVRQLVFPDVGVRRAQERLRRLWSHRYLDRHYIPFVLDGEHLPPATAGRPFYTLATRGASMLAADRGIEPREIAQTPEANRQGYATLEHHLVVTDLMVALSAACRDHPDVAVESLERETLLRQKVAAWSKTKTGPELPLVPDGAFTLRYPPTDARATFYVEVVRAGVKGGNETLSTRFLRYVEAHHRGLFGRLYGHSSVRAVLILTPTDERAAHYAALARRLKHGSRLFWFGSYATKDARGREVSSLTPDTILTPRWRTATGDLLSFIPPRPPAEQLAPAANNPSPHVCAPHAIPTQPTADGESAPPRRDDVSTAVPPVRHVAGGSLAPPVAPRQDRLRQVDAAR